MNSTYVCNKQYCSQKKKTKNYEYYGHSEFKIKLLIDIIDTLNFHVM